MPSLSLFGTPWRIAGLSSLAMAVALIAVFPAARLRGQTVAEAPEAKPDDVGFFMRAKLGHSQHVLEGLTLADFDLIARGAKELSLASQASSWEVLQTADYARQSSEFRRSCDLLHRAAEEKNLDGAALAWMEVMMKCIQCHKYVRDERNGPSR
jgi:hypothetical protein